jgi:hypothetical protein
MRSTYTAYATLASGQNRRREFKSSTNAVTYARRIARERGACFVVRDNAKVIFNTHKTLEDVLTHENVLRPKEKAC